MATITNPHYATMTDRFRQFRKHLGLSQSEFGEKLGLDQTSVSAIEKGKQDITIRTVYLLMDLDCNPDWLMFARGPLQLSKAGTPSATVEVREFADATEYLVRVVK